MTLNHEALDKILLASIIHMDIFIFILVFVTHDYHSVFMNGVGKMRDLM